jgi:hypothetical protein
MILYDIYHEYYSGAVFRSQKQIEFLLYIKKVLLDTILKMTSNFLSKILYLGSLNGYSTARWLTTK